MTSRTNVEQLIAKRQRALKGATTELREDIDFVIDWFKDEQEKGILARYELGKHVVEVRAIYGEKGIKKLKAFIHEDPSLLYKVEAFANLYTEEEAKRLTKMKMADEMTYLSFNHIRLLISIDDKDKRNTALRLTMENCWNSSQLGSYVRELFKGPKKERKRVAPKNAKALIDQQLSFAADFENRNVAIWRHPSHSLTAQVAKVNPNDYDSDLEEKLSELAHNMRKVANEAVERAEEAERKYEEVKRVLETGNVKINEEDLVVEAE